MSEYDINSLRENYHALRDIKKIVEETGARGHVIESNLVREYENFLANAEKDLPGLLNSLNSQEFFSHQGGTHTSYYRYEGILVHISRNLSKLNVRVDQQDSTPVTVSKTFDFVTDDELRKILERDYQELQRGIVNGNWKSSIIISGGSIEAILLDLLMRNAAAATSSSKAPRESELNKWDLNSLIEVSVEEKLINSGVATLSHSVREYRNLIHPGVEIRKGLKVEPEEAKIAMNVLDMLIRELS